MKSKRKWAVACLALTLAAVALVVLLWPRSPELYLVTILPSLGGNRTMVYAVNNRGQVVGVSRLANGDEHAFLWDRQGGMRDLGPLSGNISINDRGQIAGTMRDPNGHDRAFVCDPNGGRRLLPTLGGKRASAEGINNLGQVVGGADTAAGIPHAFIWDVGNGIRDLTPPGVQAARASAINDTGLALAYAGSDWLLIDTRAGRETPRSIPAPPHGASYQQHRHGRDSIAQGWQ